MSPLDPYDPLGPTFAENAAKDIVDSMPPYKRGTAVSDTVLERLAEKWRNWTPDGEEGHTSEDEARWWLNAIADELTREGNRLMANKGEHYTGRYESAKWLRSRAKEGGA